MTHQSESHDRRCYQRRSRQESFHYTRYKSKANVVWARDSRAASSVCTYLSATRIQCRVVALRANVGELIGISCKERVGGRILWWAGQARELVLWPFLCVLQLRDELLIVHVTQCDYMQGTRMSFKSKADAIHFAEKQGSFGMITFVLFPSRGLIVDLLCRWDYYLQHLPWRKFAQELLGELRI